jgi:hypothetical protein
MAVQQMHLSDVGPLRQWIFFDSEPIISIVRTFVVVSVSSIWAVVRWLTYLWLPIKWKIFFSGPAPWIGREVCIG